MNKENIYAILFGVLNVFIVWGLSSYEHEFTTFESMSSYILGVLLYKSFRG